jgi:hypothetical protein
MAKKRMPKAVREYVRKIGKAAASKGGLARHAKLTLEQRSEIARKAARAGWAKRLTP